MTKENFIKIPDIEKHPLLRIWSYERIEEWIKKYKEDCLYDYDKNMEYYESLSRSYFKRKVRFFTEKYNFKEIDDLNEADQLEGLYMMVLDEYCQCYIGISTDIKRRISEHWASQKNVDSILLRDKDSSRLPIDCFRALDTTRIFILDTYSTSMEEVLIDSFDSKYLMNRMLKDGIIRNPMLNNHV